MNAEGKRKIHPLDTTWDVAGSSLLYRSVMNYIFYTFFPLSNNGSNNVTAAETPIRT